MGTRCCECWGDPERSLSHGHYSPSSSKTFRAATGCSVRFAGNPDRTKERGIERLVGQHAPQPAKAKEAVADHEAAQQAFHENRERLREERLAREAAAGPMLYPAPELPDDTPIENVRFSTRIRNAVTAVGWKTVGEIREASDATLLGLQDLGPGSVTSLRETLGLSSTDGVRPVGKKPA